MSNYPRSAYGYNNPNAGRPANGDFNAFGGYCWPNCPPNELMGTTDYTSKFGEHLRVSLRREIIGLVELMFRIADTHDYRIYATYNGEVWGPWGSECRAISGTNRPSGHSGALALDINAPLNPYSYTFESNMPPAMVAAFEAIGFYWGGRYEGQKYDAMHFSYCYRPGDVAGHVAAANGVLAGRGAGTGVGNPGDVIKTPEQLEEDELMTAKGEILAAITELKAEVAQVGATADAGTAGAVWGETLQSPLGEHRALKGREWLFEIRQKADDNTAVGATLLTAVRDIATLDEIAAVMLKVLGRPEVAAIIKASDNAALTGWLRSKEFAGIVRKAVTGQPPPPPPPPPRPTRHTVKEGETLSGIAGLYGLDLTALLAANKQVTDPDAVNVGDILTIPKA